LGQRSNIYVQPLSIYMYMYTNVLAELCLWPESIARTPRVQYSLNSLYTY
jgi:hypothetical protein